MMVPHHAFAQCGSLAAGVLIGMSMVAGGLALTETATAAWQAALVLGAPVILVLGIALQVLVVPSSPPGAP